MNLKFIEVKFKELHEQVNDWILDIYNKSEINLTAADPYGHILGAVAMIYSNSMIYLKRVNDQFDLNNPNNNNGKMINAWARMGGYNPGRAISANGTISIQLKPGIDILTDIPGGEITILGGTKITNKKNDREYFIDLGTDKVSYNLQPNNKYYFPIVQGRVERISFTGTGEQMQSFSINLPNLQSPENFRYTVSVNGQIWSRRDHLYDMLSNEPAYIILTGIAGGLDLYFGTGNFGQIPQIGDEIEVRYVVSDGALGNIPHKLPNDWTFVDDVYDKYGSTIDVEQNFNIFIEDEIGMGANPENPKFTKLIMPFVSRNFVLARPEQYIFHLKRLNIFSQIDAYTTEKGSAKDNEDDTDDSIVYLFLVPDISLFLQGGGTSYFDLDMSAFTLDENQKTKIDQYLKTQGIIALGNAVKILDPIVNRYAINVRLRIYNDANPDNVRSGILAVLSNYFTNMERRGIIPRSDLIPLIKDVDGIDSVDIEFISEKNEAYHLAFEKYKANIMKNNPTINPDTIIMKGYDPNRVIGLDPKLGDIVYGKNDLPIIRGGWTDRNSIFFQETPQIKGLSSVNIIIEETTKKRLFN